MDEASIQAKKSSDKRNLEKALKKLERKCSKVMNTLCLEIQSTISKSPTKWLAVWGFGLGSGNSKIFIQSFFNSQTVEIRLYPDKSYCCVKMKTRQEAQHLLRMYNGTIIELIAGKQTLYLSYLENEPPEESLESLKCFTSERPNGLKIIPNFITIEEEDTFLQNLMLNDCLGEMAGMSLKKRTVKHFGYEFKYGSNDVDFDSPMEEGIPLYLAPLIYRMMSDKVFLELPEQLTVNHYLPGQGIPPHVDTHSCFEGPIVALSLGADTAMDFRRGDSYFAVIVPARSLLVMDKDIRYGWTHCIPSRKYDIVPDEDTRGLTALNRGKRVSLTFRKLRKSRICDCLFPEMCDSQKGKITSDNAADLEGKLVHDIYERIAPHFDDTRHTPWPKVKEFVESIECGSLLDVGCGNGKYLNLNKQIFQMGSDMSIGLLNICRDKNIESLRANALSLPLKDKSFSAVICIAVLHHISTKERRIKALKEIMRVLSVGGQALIYVWAKNQSHEEEDSNWAAKQASKELLSNKFVKSAPQPFTDFSFLPIHEHEKDFPRSDMLVPWTDVKSKDSQVHHRYYHVFTQEELKDLVLELDPLPMILESYYDQGNWVVRLQKN